MLGTLLGVGTKVRGYFEKFNADLKRAVEDDGEEQAGKAIDGV